MFKNKTLLITGGTGSFGKSFLKFILKSPFHFGGHQLSCRLARAVEANKNVFQQNKNNNNVEKPLCEHDKMFLFR